MRIMAQGRNTSSIYLGKRQSPGPKISFMKERASETRRPLDEEKEEEWETIKQKSPLAYL